MKLDALAVYAYCDKSHAEEREIWKTFLLLLLPLLLEIPKDTAKEYFERALLADVDEALAAAKKTNSVAQVVRLISAQFANALNLSAEFGLAAFLEFFPPTKVVSLKLAKVPPGEREMISEWLQRFTGVQDDENFLHLVSEWKRQLEKAVVEEENTGDANIDEAAARTKGKQKTLMQKSKKSQGTRIKAS